MRKWNQYMEFVLACNKGMMPPDSLLLEALRGSLDRADQNLLELRRGKNPSLTLRAFWDELQALYDRDTVAQSRLAWEAVKLPPGDLSLEKWLEFLREFQLKRDRVEDRTPTEEYQLLLKSLPHFWQKQVVNEEAKRGSGKWLVRMTNIPPRPPLQLKHMIEDATGVEILTVLSAVNGITVVCPSEEAQKTVMSLAGHTLGGQYVKCSRVDSTMSGDDICDFVTKRLQTEHRLLSLQETWGTGPKTRQVAVISNGNDHPEEKKGDSKPNSPHGKGKPHRRGNRKGNGKDKRTPPSSPGHQQTRQEQSSPQKGNGKGHDATNSKENEEGRNNSPTGQEWCGFCQAEGRNGKHDPQTCVPWQKAQKILDQAKKVCLACQRRGAPCNHYYRTCPTWQNSYKGTFQGSPTSSGGGSSTPNHPHSGLPAARISEIEHPRGHPVADQPSGHPPGSPSRGRGAVTSR